jgi:hypothetical protein
MYIPLAISLKKKNFVAFERALSPLSSQVFGLGNLKPFGQADWVEPPVVKYSVVPTAAAAGFIIVVALLKPRMAMLGLANIDLNMMIGDDCMATI